ncbi:MAG: hypothetical protein M0Z27_11710 [Thermaerobacter sp.]|nr:hypothetical protein [Thermaerobacter sp.]
MKPGWPLLASLSLGLALSACAAGPPSGSSAAPTAVPAPRQDFAYGFDLSTQEPDQPSLKGFPNRPGAVTSARAVMASLPRSYVDQAIFGFGAASDPEPSPGVFDLGDVARRIAMIQAAGDTPVITLVSAPPWMKGPASTGKRLFATPPAPDHYRDFAALAVHVALRFPQVKYFVVWSELRGFWNPATRSWDYRDYTRLYNEVYRAIKRVRPDALVGGPYANLTAYPRPVRGVVSAVHGRWGYLDRGMLDAVSYWLAHKAGADFVAVDGATAVAETGDAGLANPVTAAGQYAAVDRWIRARSDLPIWWMESHIQASRGWTPAQAAAARIATLAEMAGSGASVGMQWQPQEQAGWPDEGLWTSTLVPGGGRPTPLATLLPKVLPILGRSPALGCGEPPGVLVASDGAGVLAVNTTDHRVTAEVGGSPLALLPAQVYTSFRR